MHALLPRAHRSPAVSVRVFVRVCVWRAQLCSAYPLPTCIDESLCYKDGGFPAVPVLSIRMFPQMSTQHQRSGAVKDIQRDRQMYFEGQNVRKTTSEDTFARRRRKRQVHFPQADAHHTRTGFRPAGPRGVPTDYLQ